MQVMVKATYGVAAQFKRRADLDLGQGKPGCIPAVPAVLEALVQPLTARVYNICDLVALDACLFRL